MPSKWNPPQKLSALEQRILLRVKKRLLFRFFREHRHELFDDVTQQLLLSAYSEVERGKDRVPPAQLALATLMQAAFDVPDHEVPELTVVDQRWQMVLDCHGIDEPLFSQGTLYNFRKRCIEHGLIQHLIERTVRLAYASKGYSGAALRAALDSSPLWGAGCVEDTFNLIGRAAALVVRTASERLGKSEREIADAAGIPLATASSVKAALDLDWSNAKARQQGLQALLAQVDALRTWLNKELAETISEPPLAEQIQLLDELVSQDTEPDPAGSGRRIREGVAENRRISIHDPAMRHGRKSASKRFNGYKRHAVVDLDIPGLVRAVEVTAANEHDSVVTERILARLEANGTKVKELHVDRAYVDGPGVPERIARGMRLVAKPHPVGNGELYDKTAFRIDLSGKTATCPAGVEVPIKLGERAVFPATTCDSCSQRDRCTKVAKGKGRTLRIHEHEDVQQDLRARQATPEGRRALRERVAIEHGLARIGQTQGTRARYRGLDTNAFDLSRHAVISNCYVLNGIWRRAA